MSTPAAPGLSFRGVAHHYGGVRAIERFDLDVAPGEVVCLVGPSGCGKTTALRIAAGLEQPEKGDVFVGGRRVAGDGVSVAPEKRRVGLVFQDCALFPHLTVLENVAFGLRSGSAAERRRRAGDMLDLVGLAAMADRHPTTLSGGQQQRIALARALAPAPDVMLLDEPFANLDSGLRAQLRADALALLRAAGAPTLFVTHDPEEAMLAADRVAVMRDGRLLQAGAPDQVYFEPVNSFVASFFGPVNRFTGMVFDGMVKIPLGCAPAPGLAEGTMAEVLVRPEALLLGCDLACEDAAAGAVRGARFAGDSAIVSVDLHDAHGDACCLECRVFGRTAYSGGEQVSVSVDRNRVFVFPLETGETMIAA